MKKRVERVRKSERFSRLLSGLFIGSVLMFQGTGFITGEAKAADPVARNRDVTSFVEQTTNLSDSDYNYGLYGSPLSKSVNIYDGVSAVIGKLSVGSESLNPAEAVTMTMGSGSKIQIGLNESGTSSDGTLYVSGPWGSDARSELVAASGSAISVGADGGIQVGFTDAGKYGAGTLTIANGASLANAGTGSTIYDGLTVHQNGILNFGAADGVALTNFYSGSGLLRNFGEVNVHNNADGSDTFAVSNYTDYSSDYGKGSLNVAGDAFLGAANMELYGTVDVDGDLDLSSDSSKVAWATTSTIKADGLVTVFNDNASTGADLKVNSTNATAGGLLVERLAGAGGALTIGDSADTVALSVLNVAGLDDKFNADGTRSAEGLYDVNLGYNLYNYGTINLKDEDASGIIFTGASSYTNGSGEVVDPVVGFHNEALGKINASGDLHLYGVDLNSGIAGHSALIMTNQGVISVAGDLDIDSATAVAFNNDKEVSAESMTVGDRLTVTNAVGGKFAADSVRLNGGTLQNSGDYTFNEMTLSDGNIRGIYTAKDLDDAKSKVTVNGMVDMVGGTEFTKDAASDPTVLTITGEGGFDGKDYTLAFTNTSVRNAGVLADSALRADTLKFNAGSDYKYTGTGTNILDGNVKFDADAVLSVDASDPLYITAGNTLVTGKEGNRSKIRFDLDGEENSPLITLVPSGSTGAAAEIHSDIVLDDTLRNYTPGKRVVTLIETSNADSVYDIGSISVGDGLSGNSLFMTRSGRVSDDKTDYLLDITTKGFDDFAQTVNQHNAAQYIDGMLKNPEGISDELGDFITDVMDLSEDTDPRAVNRVLDALSGANRANAMMLAMTDPWQYSFNQLGWQTHRDYTPQCSSCSSCCRGQMEYYGGEYYGGEVYDDGMIYEGGYGYGSVFGLGMASPKSMWAAAHTTSFNARNDDNCDKYGITNTGISLGYDMINYSGATVGVTFDYSQPFLYSSWEDVNQHIDQSNFNLGLYGRRDYWNGFSLTGYVGFGLQHMNSKRNVRMAGIDPSLAIADDLNTGNWYRSGYDGQSLAAALKIARDMPLYNWCVIRPLVQFDMQQVWLGEGEETGSAIALKYNKSDWNRTLVRAGFETEKNTQFARFTSRFLYGCQLAGDSAPEMNASFVGDSTGNSMTIYGVDLGKNYFDAGLGALGYLDCDYRWALSGNYDFIATEQSAAHTGTVALSYSF